MASALPSETDAQVQEQDAPAVAPASGYLMLIAFCRRKGLDQFNISRLKFCFDETQVNCALVRPRSENLHVKYSGQVEDSRQRKRFRCFVVKIYQDVDSI